MRVSGLGAGVSPLKPPCFRVLMSWLQGKAGVPNRPAFLIESQTVACFLPVSPRPQVCTSKTLGCWNIPLFRSQRCRKGLQSRYCPLSPDKKLLHHPLKLSHASWALPTAPGTSGWDFPFCHPPRDSSWGCGLGQPRGTCLSKVTHSIHPRFPRQRQGRGADRTCQWGEGKCT